MSREILIILPLFYHFFSEEDNLSPKEIFERFY